MFFDILWNVSPGRWLFNQYKVRELYAAADEFNLVILICLLLDSRTELDEIVESRIELQCRKV